MPPIELQTYGCRVVFGDSSVPQCSHCGTAVLHVGLPLLDGAADDLILGGSAPEEVEGFTIFRSESRIAGFWQAAPGLDLETGAREAYTTLLPLLGAHRLYRVWNFVPEINAVVQGLENYRRFCRGRSLAFEAHFGSGFRQQLPAASAVGTRGGSLAIAFVGGRDVPVHFENPAQVPAFNYPPQYGPRPPSFARATSVRAADGHEQIFISGTAAIRDHRTIGAGDLAAQLGCTVANLKLIGMAAGSGPELGAPAQWKRSFRIYLRHENDFAATATHLDRELLQPGDTAQYVQADICRADLRVEIEATLAR